MNLASFTIFFGILIFMDNYYLFLIVALISRFFQGATSVITRIVVMSIILTLADKDKIVETIAILDTEECKLNYF